ncbi:hypothetical protein [Acinetobacter indicus]|uniref:hypothetical protein n=1 Tax=Acinetobacter indicus TaxID=756892 RepID=UPI0025760FA7|nr:hypothetical protein [Acinetobacter indicus]MDM1330227.1 hypothetical protein [Acinetobacter indicus]MDM1337482.1 hypothetical protein [Acinetobacter indicus]
MHEIIPPLTSSDYIGLFSIFMTTLVGLLAVIYGRKSYFVSLKNFETEKNMYKKAEFYIREFVNAHPERKVEPFLKKIASDDLNGGVELPTTITDVLIENYADYYFYLVKSLKTTWKSYKVIDGEIVCIYTNVDLLKRSAAYSVLYLITGSLGFFLIANFSWFLSSYGTGNIINTISTLILLITILFVIAVISLSILMKFMTIHEMSKTLKNCKTQKNLGA